MGIYLNPGNQAFQEAVNSEIYVDKSSLLSYTNKRIRTKQKYICISRPRRFGKSMTAAMLSAYYSAGCDSKNLFDGLHIAKDPSFDSYLNRYNVIFLNIQRFLSRAKKPENLVSYLEKAVLKELRQNYESCFDEGEEHLAAALEQIFNATEKGFLFIIDEWDCIFRERQQDTEVQTSYLDFLRDLLKDQVYVELAYMTGILPIKKYGTHSALNMFEECSMTDAGVLAEYVGFTECEVQELCGQYGVDFSEMQRWYDGYLFSGNIHIYNPKSVVDALLRKKFSNYWTGTETYEALKVYIDMDFDGLKNTIVMMLGGGRCRINSRTFQNDMTSFGSKDDVLTLLVHLGYLAYDGESGEVFIPNQEVVDEFANAVESGGWEELAKTLKASEALLEATLNGDETEVGRRLDEVHMENTSVLTYNDENSLSCVIALAYFSARKNYTLIREMPLGKGFADVVFIPKRFSANPALLVELKWDKTAFGAIGQIKEKQYGDALESYFGNILLVGINYDRKTKKHTCIIEKTVK